MLKRELVQREGTIRRESTEIVWVRPTAWWDRFAPHTVMKQRSDQTLTRRLEE